MERREGGLRGRGAEMEMEMSTQWHSIGDSAPRFNNATAIFMARLNNALH